MQVDASSSSEALFFPVHINIMLAFAVQFVVRTAFILTLLRPFNEILLIKQALFASLSFALLAQLCFPTSHRIVAVEVSYILVLFALDVTFKTSKLHFPLLHKWTLRRNGDGVLVKKEL